MALSRLSLLDFRNHQDLLLTPGPGFVVLTGDNGAGKTNILEAVSLLAPGRGLRRAALTEMSRQSGSGAFGVSARINDIDLATGTKAEKPERRLIKINGAQSSANALSEWLSMIWVTPAMDRLFAESASERRRFLDRLVLALDPSHSGHVSRYEAAMRQRNRLLTGEQLPDQSWLGAVEAQMAIHGEAINRARTSLVVALEEQRNSLPNGPFMCPEIQISGWHWNDHFAAELRSNRERDRAAGRTLIGPHRSDFLASHPNHRQAAALCSTGEQKAMLFGIVLAHAELISERSGHPLILLLDEVAAHFDPHRREALFLRLEEIGAQTWMTGTETAPFEQLTSNTSWISL